MIRLINMAGGRGESMYCQTAPGLRRCRPVLIWDSM